MTDRREFPPMHMMKLVIRDFKSIEALTINAKGQHVRISGPNKAGKTSACDALWALVTGVDKGSIPEPIRRGADTAEITGDFGTLRVRRRFTPKGSSLLVETADGEELKRPQEVMNAILDNRGALDIGIFLNSRPQDQIAEILRVCGVEPPVSEVESILGEQIKAKDNESAAAYLERLCADDTGQVYMQRRAHGRIVDEKKKAADEALRELTDLGGRPEPEDEAKDPSAISAAISDLYAKQRERDEKAAVVSEAKESRLKVVRDLSNIEIKSDSIKGEIDELEERLAEKYEQLAGLTVEHTKASDRVVEAEKAHTAAAEALDATPDMTKEIAAKRAELEQGTVHNRQLEARRQAANFVDRMLSEHDTAKERHVHLEAALKELRELQKHLLDDVSLGVSDLSIRDGQVYIDGVPLIQASLSDKLKVSCAIAMLRQPTLRVLRLDDGEHLDVQSTETLYKIAEEHGFQVFVAAVANNNGHGLQVEIVDVDRNGEGEEVTA